MSGLWISGRRRRSGTGTRFEGLAFRDRTPKTFTTEDTEVHRETPQRRFKEIEALRGP